MKVSRLLKLNYLVQLIQSAWPIGVLLLVTIFHGKDSYSDLAIALNYGYLIGALIDFGGVNHRMIFFSKNHYNQWKNILLFKIVLCFLLFFFLDFEVVFFALSVIINPFWVYTNENLQHKYIKYSLIGRFITLPIFLFEDFILPYSMAQVFIFLILNVLIFKINFKDRLSDLAVKKSILNYYKTGFSFFTSKASTSFWLYFPLILISSLPDYNENIAYLDRLYQFSLLLITPLTLTLLKIDKKNIYTQKINMLNIFVAIAFLVCLTHLNVFGDYISTYFVLIPGMAYISYLGHGLAVNKKQISLQNYSMSIFSILFGVILYFFDEAIFSVIFIFLTTNIVTRNYIIKRC